MVLETLKTKGQERLAARWFSPQYGPGRKTVGSPAERDGIKDLITLWKSSFRARIAKRRDHGPAHLQDQQ